MYRFLIHPHHIMKHFPYILFIMFITIVIPASVCWFLIDKNIALIVLFATTITNFIFIILGIIL